MMAQTVAPHGHVTRLDPSPQVVAHARRVTREPNCAFIEGTANALDAAHNSVDVVVTSLMIHHLPEPMRPAALREMFRVIRPRDTCSSRTSALPEPARAERSSARSSAPP